MDETTPIDSPDGAEHLDERRVRALVGVGGGFGVLGLVLAVAGLCWSAALMWPLAGLAGAVALLLGGYAVWRARQVSELPEERGAYIVGLAGGLVDVTLGLVLLGIGGLGLVLLVVVFLEAASTT